MLTGFCQNMKHSDVYMEYRLYILKSFHTLQYYCSVPSKYRHKYANEEISNYIIEVGPISNVSYPMFVLLGVIILKGS